MQQTEKKTNKIPKVLCIYNEMTYWIVTYFSSAHRGYIEHINREISITTALIIDSH